jgi:hypothetical protein
VLSSNAHVTVVVPPTNKTVLAGANATFNVIGVGPAPLTYQWQRNGISIPNAIATTFTLTNVQAADAGAYSVVVTNALGQPASFEALLQVIAPPLITQPERLTDGSFRATITGLVPNEPYTIEHSTNLVDWQQRQSFVAPASSAPFVDNTAGATTQRFFRVRSGMP